MSRDKRITTRQTVRLVQDAYDRFEALAIQTLQEEFGFDAEQIEQFEFSIHASRMGCDSENIKKINYNVQKTQKKVVNI